MADFFDKTKPLSGAERARWISSRSKAFVSAGCSTVRITDDGTVLAIEGFLSFPADPVTGELNVKVQKDLTKPRALPASFQE